MTKHIELKAVNQGTALAPATLALPPIEGLEEFKGSFDRLCLQAGTAAIEAMLEADAEHLCGKRYVPAREQWELRGGLRPFLPCELVLTRLSLSGQAFRAAQTIRIFDGLRQRRSAAARGQLRQIV
jgi:hypothetical protein